MRDFGDYELLAEIARGGMGIVFRARQISLNRTVALKLITAGHLATAAAVRRFQLEAEAAARLDHPNIVPIYEIGEREGHHYFSMKLMEGPSLAALVAAGGRGMVDGKGRKGERKTNLAAGEPSSLPGPMARSAVGCETPREIVTLIVKVAKAVHYAHQRGILHRDLKPGNILLDERGEPYVTDFGLAKLIEHKSELTHSGMVMGTPSYMSPEQAGGKNTELTTAADLWSLGAILYELLTGQCAFRGATPVETLRQVMEREPTKPSALNSAVGRDLETITLKCLEKDPAARYASAAALADDLEHWLRYEPIIARRTGVFERVGKWGRRQPMLAGALFLLQFVLVLGLAGILWQWRQAVLARRAEKAERQRAERAENDALIRLHEAKLHYVRAQRLSARPGQRFDSLAALTEAASGTNRLELRNEAIACLVLPDLRPLKSVAKEPRPKALRFDPNLRRYLTNDSSGNVIIRDVETDALIHLLPQQGAPIKSAIISPSANLLASTDRAGRTFLWDLATLVPRPLEFPSGAALITFTPDSRELVVKHNDGSLHFLNSRSTVEERAFPGSKHLPWIKFNSTGDKFLTVVGGKAVIRRTKDGILLRTLTAPEGSTAPLEYPTWHPDGRRVAGAWQNNIGLWDTETGRPLGRFAGHESEVVGLVFTRTGEYLASASWDGSTRLWHTDTHRQVLSLPDSGNALSISSDDRRLSYEVWDESEAKVFELADQSAALHITLPPRELKRHTGHVVFSPDGELILAPDNDGIHVFHKSSAAPVAVLPVRDTPSTGFAPDGSILFTGGAKGVRRWPIRWSDDYSEVHVGPPAPIYRTYDYHRSMSTITVSRDGQWLVAQGKDIVVALRDHPPSPPVRFGIDHLGNLPRITAEGSYVALIPFSRAGVQIHNLPGGQLVTNLPGTRIWDSAFSPDGRWLACTEEDSTTVRQTANWSVSRRFPHQSENILHPLAFSPDSRMLAITVSSREIRLLNVETGEELATFPGGPLTTSLCFSPAGDRLAIAHESGYLRIWDLRRLREQLASLHLDWEMPPYPSAGRPLRGSPVRVIVHTNVPASQPEQGQP